MRARFEGKKQTKSLKLWEEKQMFRSYMAAACVSAAALFTSSALWAGAEYPTKPIEMTITFGAGGTADISGRLSAQAASGALGEPIAVVNRTGGGGSIGFEHVRVQDPDGYNIGWLSASILTTTLLGTLPQEWDAWEYVANITVDPTAIVVRDDAPWQTMQEFIEAARQAPGSVRIGHAGVGSFTYTAAAALANEAEIQPVFVPVGTRRVPSLLGGEVEAISVHPPEAMSLLRAGEVRFLGILAPERNKAFSDVPTFAELGYDLGFYQFRGVFVPKGTSQAAKDKLASAFRHASEDEKLLEAAEQQGFSVFYVGLEDYPGFVEQQNRLLSKVINELGLR